MPEAKQMGPLASLGLGGTAAVITVNFTHPIETIKTRIQVSGGFSFSHLMKNEGVTALWKGIQPAWLREASYASIKIGGYAPIRDAIGAGAPGAPVWLKFMAGSLSGGAGSIVGNPFDVLKTMQQANKAKQVPMADLAGQLMNSQGIRGFYRGVEANVMRAFVLNGSKMASYDVIKGSVVKATGWQRKDLKCMFVSSVGAGFIMTVCVTPFDVVRTALMNQPTDKKIYNGFIDCGMKLIKGDGPTVLYRGFLPIWARFAPSATLQLVIYESLLVQCGFKSL